MNGVYTGNIPLSEFGNDFLAVSLSVSHFVRLRVLPFQQGVILFGEDSTLVSHTLSYSTVENVECKSAITRPRINARKRAWIQYRFLVFKISPQWQGVVLLQESLGGEISAFQIFSFTCYAIASCALFDTHFSLE